jgi:ABC-type uncharacterized transport system permease subunit
MDTMMEILRNFVIVAAFIYTITVSMLVSLGGILISFLAYKAIKVIQALS